MSYLSYKYQNKTKKAKIILAPNAFLCQINPLLFLAYQANLLKIPILPSNFYNSH